MTTYSFADVQASITGPGGSISLGAGAAVAEEGISTEMAEDKNTMTIGADGSGMHSLHQGNSGRVTVRLLKTSPTNQMLMAMYNLQRASSALWGQNVITISNPVSGDMIVCRGVAFQRQPNLTYAKDAGINEWSFPAIHIDGDLGTLAGV